MPTWKPQLGPQTEFVESQVFEVIYGGARGGGKTDAALGEFATHAAKYGESARGLLVRRTRGALEPTIARARQIFVDAQWAEQKSRCTWPNGVRLSFRHLDNDRHADAYQGHDYARLYIEELTQFASPRLVDKLALIPALIVGAAGVAGAAISSNAASRVSDNATATANRDNALQQQTYDSNKALIQPEVDRGNAAADELQGFLGLGAINALTGASTNNANQQQANNVSAATTVANAELGRSNSIDALIAKGVGAYGLTRGMSSFGAPTNAFAPGG